MIQVRFWFTWPRTFLLLQIKNLVGFLSILLLETPRSTNQHCRSVQIRQFWVVLWLRYYCNNAHLTVDVWVLPFGPGTQLLPLHLVSQYSDFSSLCEVWLTEKNDHRTLQDARTLLTNLFLPVVVKGMLSQWPSQCCWIDLKWQICFNPPISLSLWISSSTLNQSKSGISNSFTVGKLLVLVLANQSNKFFEIFLTLQVAILNETSVLNKPIINKFSLI